MKENLDSLSCGELVNLFLSGISEAFAVLIGKYPDLILKICAKRLRDKDKVDDAVQETYAKALGGLHNFIPIPGEKSFKKWLSVIALREACACFRVEKRDKKIKEAAKEKANFKDCDKPGFKLTNKQRILFERTIEELPEMTRICFDARRKGIPDIDVCRAYNLTKNQHAGHIHRAKKILANKLKHLFDSNGAE